jgi:uncharacterized protein YejL (UPF0352 family)
MAELLLKKVLEPLGVNVQLEGHRLSSSEISLIILGHMINNISRRYD